MRLVLSQTDVYPSACRSIFLYEKIAEKGAWRLSGL